MISGETRGLDRVAAEARRLARLAPRLAGAAVEVGGGERPASENAEIAQRNRDRGFNPFALSPTQSAHLKRVFIAAKAAARGDALAALHAVAQRALDFVRGNFQSGAGSRPLAERYAEWKAKNFPGAPPMIRTGALFRSLVARVTNG